MSEYADRDVKALGPHYIRHISAMTAEGLHNKSDIAAELAHRDQIIELLQAVNARLATEVITLQDERYALRAELACQNKANDMLGR